MDLPIHLDHEELADFCRRNHIRWLALFGSVLIDRFGSDSDVDVLVDFDPGQVPSLFGMVRLELELSELVGREVDLRTPEDISVYFRDRVVASAEVHYAA